MYYGHCAIFKHNGKLYVSFGAWGGSPDPYYIPTEYVVSNPYLAPGLSLKLIRDKTCVVVKNDMHAIGLKSLLEKHATLLVENDISRCICEYNSRIGDLLVAEDDKTRLSAETFLQRIIEGRLGVITSNAMLDSFSTYRQTSGVNNSLLPLIEHHQYIKSELLQDLGINSNWNGKREAVNSAETALNQDYLMPLVDQMLEQRQKGLEKVKELFGYDIKVKLSSSWEDNREQIEKELKDMDPEGGEKEDVEDNNSGEEEIKGDI